MKNFNLKAVIAGLFSIAIITASCKKETSFISQTLLNTVPAGQNQLSVFLTDDQSLIFDSIFIDIQMLEVKVERQDGSEHWDTLNIRPGIYNILRFRNGVDTLFATGFIANGEIKKIRLTLGTRNSVVLEGVTFPLALHNNEKQVIINIPNTDRIDPAHFRLWLDFDGHGSVIEIHHNQFELNPRINSFSKEHSQELEGKVKPEDAQPVIVSVINGSDTVRAITEHDGEFKIRGINAATVNVFIHPSNGYKDSLISNIVLRQGDDTKLMDIILHK